MLKPPRPQFLNRIASPNRTTPNIRGNGYFLSPQVRGQAYNYQQYQNNDSHNILSENRVSNNDVYGYSQKKNPRIQSFKSCDKLPKENEVYQVQGRNLNNYYSPQNAFMKSPRTINSNNPNVNIYGRQHQKENVSPVEVEPSRRKISFKQDSPITKNFGRSPSFIISKKPNLEEMYNKNVSFLNDYQSKSPSWKTNVNEGVISKLKSTANFLGKKLKKFRENDLKVVCLLQKIKENTEKTINSNFPNDLNLNFKKNENFSHFTTFTNDQYLLQQNNLPKSPSSLSSGSEFRSSFNRVVPLEERHFDQISYQTTKQSYKIIDKPIIPNSLPSLNSLDVYSHFHYEGDLNGSLRQGYGVIKNDQGKKIYSGDWKANVFHGHGSLENHIPITSTNFNFSNFKENLNNWISFEGQFENGLKEGMGTLYLCNGGKYIGHFKGNYPHGDGCYFDKLGGITMGKWENGILKEE